MSNYIKDNIENYGPSTVELIEINMSNGDFVSLDCDGKNMQFPVLDLKKYDEKCHCYALIERLKELPVTMVDILYTYGADSYSIFRDSNFFLRKVDRKYINECSMKYPGIILAPIERGSTNNFYSVIRTAIQDSISDKVCTISNESTETIEKKIVPDSKKVKKDGVALEFVKDFYELLTGLKVKRPTDAKKVKVNYSFNQQAIFMKSGEIIVDGVQSSRYLTSFKTHVESDTDLGDGAEKGDINDMLSIYISNMNDIMLLNDTNYRAKFGKAIFSSHILEALASVNSRKYPLISYVGRFNGSEEKIDVDIETERIIEKINRKIRARNGESR